MHIGRLPDCKNRTERFAAIKKFMDVKMTRLSKFYKYGLSTVGWNKYSYIDIEFDNQIICRKKSSKHAYVAPVAMPVAVQQTAEQAQQTAEQAQPNATPTQSTTEPAQGKKETTKPAAKEVQKKSDKTEKKSDKTEKKSDKTEKKSDKTDKKSTKSDKKSKDDKPQKKKSSNKR